MSDFVKRKSKKSEVIFWSIALPGLGQLLNGKYIKGIFFIIVEIIVNIKGLVNIVIIHSFLGQMELAIEKADYLWLMFYPCIYLFAIWDAYRDAGGGGGAYQYVPFVFSAYIGTIGVIYSSQITIYGYYIGPIFLPIIAMVIGFLLGLILKKVWRGIVM